VDASIATAVRRARPSDAAALTRLVNRAYEIEAFFVDGQRTDADEIEELIRSGGFLVLEYEGGICAAVRRSRSFSLGLWQTTQASIRFRLSP